MTQISMTELKTNTGKYVAMAQEQDIFITKNGKTVAKLVTAKVDKVAAMDELFSLLPKGMEVNLEAEREERILR